MLTTLAVASGPIRFTLWESKAVRFESWAQVQMWQNPRPLPAGFALWPTIQPLHQIDGQPNIHLYPAYLFQCLSVGDPVGYGFGSDYPTVCRRIKAGDHTRFEVEDGIDEDFNDFTAVLRRVGAPTITHTNLSWPPNPQEPSPPQEHTSPADRGRGPGPRARGVDFALKQQAFSGEIFPQQERSRTAELFRVMAACALVGGMAYCLYDMRREQPMNPAPEKVNPKRLRPRLLPLTLTWFDDPDWIEDDYTAMLLDVLRQTSFRSIPVQDNIAPAEREERTLRLLNQIETAGLEVRVRASYYDSHIPVLTATLMPRRPGVNSAPSLPTGWQRPLSDDERQACQLVRDRFAQDIPPEWRDTTAVHYEETKRPGWELTKLIVGRMGVYLDLISEARAERYITSLPNGFALSFAGTFLGATDIALDAAGVENQWARSLVSCAAAGIGVAGVIGSLPATAAPLAITWLTMGTVFTGTVGAIETGEMMVHCLQLVGRMAGSLKDWLNDESRAKQAAETIGHNLSLTHYERPDRATIRLMNGTEEKDRFRIDVTSSAPEVTRIGRPGGSGIYTHMTDQGVSCQFDYDGWVCNDNGDVGEVHLRQLRSDTDPGETTIIETPRS